MSIEQEARKRTNKILGNSQARLKKDEIAIRAFIDCADWLIKEIDNKIGENSWNNLETSSLRSFICDLTGK